MIERRRGLKDAYECMYALSYIDRYYMNIINTVYIRLWVEGWHARYSVEDAPCSLATSA